MEKGYYYSDTSLDAFDIIKSQSTIKMEKGYYINKLFSTVQVEEQMSQSTIKMEKGYYLSC